MITMCRAASLAALSFKFYTCGDGLWWKFGMITMCSSASLAASSFKFYTCSGTAKSFMCSAAALAVFETPTRMAGRLWLYFWRLYV